MKKIAILYSEYTPTIDAIKYQLKDFVVDCYTNSNEIIQTYDLIITTNFSDRVSGNVLKCHHSILPAFNRLDPEKEAILSGVKISGITFLYNDKIIAQYPIFITSDMHYEDLKQELNYLEQVLFPIIAEKVLKNEPFETKELLGNHSCCSGGCSGCHC